MGIPFQEVKDERHAIIDAVRNWADLNTDAILDPACQIFTTPNIDGLVGYKLVNDHAIVFGEPVCGKKDRIPLAQAFHAYCKEKNIKVTYIIVSEEFAKEAIHNQLSSVMIDYADKLIFNPKQNPLDLTGPNATLVRKKVKRAIKENTTIEEYLSNDLALEREIEEIGCAWLKSRHGPQVYIGNLSLFSDREGKRWFYAKNGEKIVGVAVINQLKEQKSWLLNNVMLKDAPQGTSELLVTTILSKLAAEDCENIFCGPIPATELGNIVGVGKVSETIIRTAFIIAKKLYHFDRHNKFWEKFQPESKKSYLLFQKNIGLSTVKSLLTAVNATM